MGNKTYIFYKPYGVLSQFTKEHAEHRTLAEYLDVEPDVYPVGRLDRDSEGLLLLTNDKALHSSLLHPQMLKWKTYAVQVEGQITTNALQQLEHGVVIRVNKKEHRTAPAIAKMLNTASFPPRNPPIRERKNVPTSWVKLSISEGKNRQVRRMCAAVGFPVLRLIRLQIDTYSLADLNVGESRLVLE